MRGQELAAVCIALIASSPLFGTEPNDTFETATPLPAGVLSVMDEFNVASFPDTLLGIQDQFGDIYFVDDDGSPAGDGRASGVGSVPTNSGSIDFAVTGFGDDEFFGAHGETGEYEVFVDVRDLFGDPVDSFSELRTLAPGVVHEFFFNNFEWLNGEYDVYIDNTVGEGDVDFFTFTGLSPGAMFSARTLDTDNSGIDTYLGWFDSGGALLDTDDDDGGGPFNLLSLIEGMVPANGMLTFAVTGFGDEVFTGAHGEIGAYELQVQLDAGLPGDYNNDQVVDAADYVVWRKMDGTPDGYNTWRANFGKTAGSESVHSNNSAVPEPGFVLWFIGAAILWARRWIRQSSHLLIDAV